MIGGGPRDFMLQQEGRKAKAVRETLARFWVYFADYKHILAIVAVLVIVSTYFQVTIPNLIGQTVDCYLTPATQAATSGAAAAIQTAGRSTTTVCWYGTVPPGAPAADYIA